MGHHWKNNFGEHQKRIADAKRGVENSLPAFQRAETGGHVTLVLNVMEKTITLHFDGASKGNPGPSGIGAVLLEASGARHEVMKFIGHATNNQAEYTALIEALEQAHKLGAKHVQVFSDSELVVRQLNGIYKIKEPQLKLLYDEVKRLIHRFQQVKFTHVPREKNTEADALANQAVKMKNESVTMTQGAKEPMKTHAATEAIKQVPRPSGLGTRFFDFCHPTISRDKAEIMIFGLPYEGTVNSRPGAVHGPQAIRDASHVVESYSPFLDRDLETLAFYDDGDIRPSGKGKPAFDGMAKEIIARLPKHVKPVFLGGDHASTYSAVKALVDQGKEFSIVHLDAHPDCQDSFENDPWCYATVMRRSKEILKGEIYQLGIRTCTKPELDYATKHNKLFLCDQYAEGLRYLGEQTRGKNVYVTFDIDALDPSLAPGTSNPEYGGLLPAQVHLLLKTLQKANVIGFDIVEVAPNLDPSGITPIVAAEIARDAILAWWGR